MPKFNILEEGLIKAVDEAVVRAETQPEVIAASSALDGFIEGYGMSYQDGVELRNLFLALHVAAAEAGFRIGLTAGFKLSNEVRALNEAGGGEGDGK